MGLMIETLFTIEKKTESLDHTYHGRAGEGVEPGSTGNGPLSTVEKRKKGALR